MIFATQIGFEVAPPAAPNLILAGPFALGATVDGSSIVGIGPVVVSTPGAPAFTSAPPSGPDVFVVPVAGPPGMPGAGSTNDASVASFIADVGSQTRAALKPAVETIVEPPIDIDVLFENALA